ncbi:hypothetical protein TNCV_4403851 [Trichonephila clavipes]|uniref:Uncharacterized protein n=1 Tax=Trichonephila clavipes TaxID=2585209 RepID=A0A8X6SEV0_TRICX|nr:hypothetical protein TNCV_4403851 [Trichonephila clavipes]
MKAIGNGPRKFESRSSDKENNRATPMEDFDRPRQIKLESAPLHNESSAAQVSNPQFDNARPEFFISEENDNQADPGHSHLFGPSVGGGRSGGMLGGVNGDPTQGGETKGYFVKYPSPHPDARETIAHLHDTRANPSLPKIQQVDF